MRNDLIFEEKNQLPISEFKTVLDEILRTGARQLLQAAIESEVQDFLLQFKEEKDMNGRRRVIRNGYLPERSIQTGIGSLQVNQPRIRDRRKQITFTSTILPPYVRKTASVEAVISTLYLKGISTGDFSEALEALLGENAKGLSPSTIVRMKSEWEHEFNEWCKRDLSGKHYIYFWADGVYFNVRLSDERPCILVIIGALADGRKEIVAIHDGQRESKLSWSEVLYDLQRRGLSSAPKLAIGDGALGFWSALEEVFPSVRHQRCWVHKTMNVLDKMHKSLQESAKKLLHEMYMAPTKEQGVKAFDTFLKLYESKFPKACECLKKDKEVLFTFYDYPAAHWAHIRTTNPIESTFATIRHRTRQTKGCGSRSSTLTMVFKLSLSAEKGWRRIRGYELIEKLIQGVSFKDGIEVINESVETA